MRRGGDPRRAARGAALTPPARGYRLLNAQKAPQDKYDAPVTSAQEVGWNTKPLVPPNPRFKHGLAQGESTKFAENYTQKMAGAHMFHGKSGKYLRF